MLALLLVLVGGAGLWAAVSPSGGAPRLGETGESESSAPAPIVEKRLAKTAAPVICRGTTPVVERFEVTNDTGKPVVVKDIERSCGCLEAKLDKQRLEPGETAELTMRVELTPRGERRTVAANVVTENAGYWRFELAVTGYPLLEFPQDIEHLNAGEVQPGGELVKEATLYTHSLAPAEPPEIVSATAEAPGTRIDFANGKPEPAAEGVLRRPVQVTLRIPPERLTGRFTKNATFELSGIPADGAPGSQGEGVAPGLDVGNGLEVPWSYSWAVISNYEMEPARIVHRVGTATTPKHLENVIVIRNRGQQRPPPILSVDSPAPWLRIGRGRPFGDYSYEIPVAIRLSKLPAAPAFTELRITLDDEAESVVIVPFSVLTEVGSDSNDGHEAP